MMVKKVSLITFLAFFGISQIFADSDKLLRQPSVNSDKITFSYGNNIWVVAKDGGDAQRLTTTPGREFNPKFSPDGEWIAYSGQKDGNISVYVIPARGGSPKRLTHHPTSDIVRGWTPDGKVLFTSGRKSAPVGYPKFFKVGFDDGLPEPLPIPRGYRGAYSPDGNSFAYEMVRPSDEEWRNYRGGQNRPIWVLDMDDHSLEEIPDNKNVRNQYPVWIDETIYFISDRDYAMNLYSYSMEAEELKQLTFFSEFDIKYLSAGEEFLVFEYGGEIYTFNPDDEEYTKVDINISGDFPWAISQWKDAENFINKGALSPTGVRAVFEARGDIFTIPADKGDWRNITETTGVRQREPAWSPNGENIAWFSDRDGEYHLKIGTQDGLEEPRKIDLPEPTFNYTPQWSPDSKHIIYTDANLKLWKVNVETEDITFIDQDRYIHPQRTIDPVWSPDSKWIVYAKRLENQFHALKVYSLEDDEVYQLTDGMSDAISPAWDASGKYIYFLASTNFGLNTGWLDMSAYDRPVERAIYMIVLDKDEPSPLLPESDEENPGNNNNDNNNPQEVVIDFENIDQRILALNIPERDYTNLKAAEESVIFYTESVPHQWGNKLHRYNLEERESQPYLSPVNYFDISADGKKLLYRSSNTWGIVGTEDSPDIGDGRLDISNMKVKIDPRQEYEQMYDEAWRILRDYVYVENMHGADWDEIYEMYKQFVEHVNHRDDLNYLLSLLSAEVSMGHTYVGGGDMPETDDVNVGLLGTDLEIVDGHYRIEKIYTGENWNPDLKAPLSAPGVEVSEGDYILAVNGRELTAPTNPYSLFENTVDKQTVLTVNDRPTMEDSRNITVVPVSGEGGLRRLHWVEENRRKVDEMSDGKLAYVWLPNTAQAGYSYFNRYYFSQQHKQGAVIDERFNGGGSAADYMVDIMARELHGFFNNRIDQERPFTSPGAGIWGPKVMVINESAGSGGDLLPFMFRNMDIGPLVGTTTWGGLIGIWDYPGLIDGGMVSAPRGGFYNTDGEWDVENEGVAPDIEIEMTPKKVIEGQDPQLERAVEEALRMLEEDPVEILPEPDSPERAKRPEEDSNQE